MTEKRSEQRYTAAIENGKCLFQQGSYGSASIEFRAALKTALDYSLSHIMIRESAESLYESLLSDARALSERKQLTAAEERAIEARRLAREQGLGINKELSALKLLRELDETVL